MENTIVELVWTGRATNMLLGETVYSGQRLQVNWLLAKQKHEEGRGWFCPQYDQITNKVEQEVEASISTPVREADQESKAEDQPPVEEAEKKDEEPVIPETTNVVETERQKLLEMAAKRKEQLKAKKQKKIEQE